MKTVIIGWDILMGTLMNVAHTVANIKSFMWLTLNSKQEVMQEAGPEPTFVC